MPQIVVGRSPGVVAPHRAANSAPAFGSPTVTFHIHPAGFAEVQAWSTVAVVTPAGPNIPGTPGNTGAPVPAGIARPGTVGSVAAVVPAGVAGSGGVGSVAVAVSAGVPESGAVGNVAVVVPGGAAEVQGFGTPTATSEIVATGFAEVSGFGTPTVTSQIQVSGFAEAPGFGVTNVVSQAGQVTLTPSGAVMSSAYGSVAVATTAGASAVGSFGGNVVVVPVGVTAASSYGSPKLTTQLQIIGYAQPTAFGQIAQIICPFGLASSVSAGTVTVAQEAGVVQAVGFGAPALGTVIFASGFSASSAFADPPIIVPTRFGSSCSPGVSPAVVSIAGVADAAAYGTPTAVVSFRTPFLTGFQAVSSFSDLPVAIPSGANRSFSYGSPTIGGIVVPFVSSQGAGRGRRRSETDLILEIWAEIEEKRRASAQISEKISDLRQYNRKKGSLGLKKPETRPKIAELGPRIDSLQHKLTLAEQDLAHAQEMAQQNAVLRAIGDELRDLSATSARARIQAYLDWLHEDDEEAIMMLM